MRRGRPPEGVYIAFVPKQQLRLSREMLSLVARRTRAFLNGSGIDRPLSILMQEAYIQGMRDAVDAMEAKRERELETSE